MDKKEKSMNEMTKSYAIKRIGELIDETIKLKEDIKFLQEMLEITQEKNQKLKEKIKLQIIEEAIDSHLKDKTEFAIEELGKVREFLRDGTSIKEPDYSVSINFIDKQIEQLKAGTND